jgi:hypothetical protein
VLCVVDDAQWLDEPSLEAILFAARRLRADGVGALIAARAGSEVAGSTTDLPQLLVGPLTDEAALAIVQAGRDVPIAEPVARHIVATAGGNPLALVEMPALLSADELAGRQPLDRPLPPGTTVERALADQLARLPRETIRALAVAAAAGQGGGDVVVRALAAAGVDPAALEQAEDQGLVRLVHGEVVFRHPLVRSAAYHAATSPSAAPPTAPSPRRSARTTPSAPGSRPPRPPGPTRRSPRRSSGPATRRCGAAACGPPRWPTSGPPG